jgi:protein-S-isoprenylcysteine O-methyltransferase Ste14
MDALMIFKSATVILAAFFVYYGMDIRRKVGARDFVAPVWQVIMKLCSIILILAFAWIALSAQHVNTNDWVSLAMMAGGVGFVVAAKRALGRAHTFTGQYLARPMLVTHGVYAITRNPLYFGVFLCEFGALLFVLNQTSASLTWANFQWLGVVTAALAYAVAFNCFMAVNEARYLREVFGDAYRHYQARVPFLVPHIHFRKENE